MRHFRQWLHVTILLPAVAAVLWAAGCASPGTSAGPGQEAQRWAGRVRNSVGGISAFKTMGCLRFDYVEEADGQVVERRTYLWDRKSGDCRLEDRSDLVNVRITSFNLRSGELHFYSGPLSAAAARAALERPESDAPLTFDKAALVEAARAAHTHDTFWLLGAAALDRRDAVLTYDGDVPFAGVNCASVTLDFDAPASGTAPAAGLEGRYRYLLNPESARPIAWAVQEGDAEPVMYYWRAWQPVGEALLPARFETPDRRRVVRFETVYVPGEIGEALFAHPYE